jgi:hypothetical protein
MGNSPSPPQVTNPNTTAANQQALNTAAGETSQQGSMVNQSTPYGSLSYSQTGTSANGTPIYTASTSLTPQQQQLLQTLQGTQGTAGTGASNLLKSAGYGAESPAEAIGNETSGLMGKAMGQETGYLQPFFNQQTEQLDNQLRNQGFAPGEPGYDNAMQNLEKSQGSTVTGFEANIEPQMFQQAAGEYKMPAQMAESLGQFGAPTMPTMQNTPALNIAPASLIQATANAQQAQQQTYNDQQSQYNNMMSGIFGIPTALLGGWASAGGLSALTPLLAAAI